MQFTTPEREACLKLVELALQEDLGTGGDLTSQALIPPDLLGKCSFVARAPGVIAGLAAASLVCSAVDNQLTFQKILEDGARVERGQCLATAAGFMRSLLATERIALNFLQRLSGIATLTAKFVDAVHGLPVRILDTRKTTPGWRLLEKFAVRCGGGHNHRLALWDGILIKDNHLAATASKLDVAAAVTHAREFTHDRVPVEVEVESIDQLRHVLEAKPAIVLLDNMGPEQLREAVKIRNVMERTVDLEASGGITLTNVRAIAETGVERISIGALTHSAPALDIALDFVQ